MIYSGLRSGKLVKIETANIDIENRIMKGGLKTAAGKNRIIPINKKILPFVKARLEEDSAFLISIMMEIKCRITHITTANSRSLWSSFY